MKVRLVFKTKIAVLKCNFFYYRELDEVQSKGREYSSVWS